MSVITLKRLFVAAAIAAITPALFASYPSAREGARMVFDESAGYGVLFGGSTPLDTSGTAVATQISETWLWNGAVWVQRFPAHTPPSRSDQVMVYDRANSRTVMYAGFTTRGELDDTWIFEGGDWHELQPAATPGKRARAAGAYDPTNHRVIVFGGYRTKADGKTPEQLYDTWSFDGTNWTQIQDAAAGPHVLNPILAYDEAHDQLLLVGVDDQAASLMYVFDPAANSWTKLTPANLPKCVNGSVMTYQRSEGTTFLTGGVCLTSTSIEEQFTWDGTDWTKVDVKTTILKAAGQAIAYDALRHQVVLYGGTYGTPRGTTYLFRNGDWAFPGANLGTPSPRSHASMVDDPVNKRVWLFGGIADEGFWLNDLWKFEAGNWQNVVAADSPNCSSSGAAFDTDRAKLVVVCEDASLFEFDGTAWKAFTALKPKPLPRMFSGLTYDPTLKKTVLFGGYDGNRYRNETWLWDGTKWAEVKNNRAPARHLTSMWYDPTLKKVVIYAGIGRRNPDDRTERYNDMWSLDGTTGWTEIKPATLPQTRYGAQVAVDPRSGHAILMGGLRVDTDDKGVQHQVYANDVWEWDGVTWKKLETSPIPPPRENAAMSFDSELNRILLFGGWASYYLSDLWSLDNTTWTVSTQSVGRRRASGT